MSEVEASIIGENGERKEILVELIGKASDELRKERQRVGKEVREDISGIVEDARLSDVEFSEEEKAALTNFYDSVDQFIAYSNAISATNHQIRDIREEKGVLAQDEIEALLKKRAGFEFKWNVFQRRAYALYGLSEEEINRRAPLEFCPPEVQSLLAGLNDAIKRVSEEVKAGLEYQLRSLTDDLEKERREKEKIARERDRWQQETAEYKALAASNKPSKRWYMGAAAIALLTATLGAVAGRYTAPEVREIERIVEKPAKVVYKEKRVEVPKVVEKPVVVYKDKIVEVEKSDLGFRVAMAGDYFFDSGKAMLSEDGKKRLKDLYAKLIKQGKYIIVEGHTDSQPIRVSGWKSNYELSWERAKAVADYLRDMGFAPEKVMMRGYGPSKPVAGNETPEQRAQNRRVTMHILREMTKIDTNIPMKN